jgi:hypothetical protein
MTYRANRTHSKPANGIIGGKLNMPARSMLETKVKDTNAQADATLQSKTKNIIIKIVAVNALMWTGTWHTKQT